MNLLDIVKHVLGFSLETRYTKNFHTTGFEIDVRSGSIVQANFSFRVFYWLLWEDESNFAQKSIWIENKLYPPITQC